MIVAEKSVTFQLILRDFNKNPPDCFASAFPGAKEKIHNVNASTLPNVLQF